ncbi:cornichon-like 4 [Sigmodon hispidus]
MLLKIKQVGNSRVDRPHHRHCVTVLMLVSLHWFFFLLELPVATWNIYRFIMVPSGNMGVFDPTEIHNRGQLKSHMKEAMIKLGFYLLCFFMYLYSMILALINY